VYEAAKKTPSTPSHAASPSATSPPGRRRETAAVAASDSPAPTVTASAAPRPTCPMVHAAPTMATRAMPSSARPTTPRARNSSGGIAATHSHGSTMNTASP
jgi:hypothetical protein